MKSLIYLSILLSSFVSVPVGAASMPNQYEPLIIHSYITVAGLDLTIANLEQEVTTVTLTDLNGRKKYFSEVVRKHNGYSWSIGLDKLPEGRYCLTVKKGDTIRKQVVLKTEMGVMCSEWK